MALWAVSDRTVSAKIFCYLVDIYVIHEYAPTVDSTGNEMKCFYEELQTTLEAKKQWNGHCDGGLNAKVGMGSHDSSVGLFGLGLQNRSSEEIAESCDSNKLFSANTLCEWPKRRKNTWISPDDKCRNQIDFRCVDQRFRAMTNSKTSQCRLRQ